MLRDEELVDQVRRVGDQHLGRREPDPPHVADLAVEAREEPDGIFAVLAQVTEAEEPRPGEQRCLVHGASYLVAHARWRMDGVASGPGLFSRRSPPARPTR